MNDERQSIRPAVGVGIAVAIGALAWALWPSEAAAAPPTPTPGEPGASSGAAARVVVPTATGTEAANLIEQLSTAADLPKGWKQFWVALSSGETENTFTSNVVLGDPKLYPRTSSPSPSTGTKGPAEAATARSAYTTARAAGYFASCPWSAGEYSWGTGGWWSMIPAYAFAAYKGTKLACRHPHYLLHPVDQFVCAVAFARRTMARRQAFKDRPTWLSLRVGWGMPSMIANDARRAQVRARWAPNVQAIGLPDDWIDSEVPPIPSWDPVARWDQLMAQFSFDPGYTGAF